MSGHDWHLHAGLDVITALDVAMDRYLGWADPRFTSTFAGFWDAGGYRGWAWGLSRILQAYIACPDSHPMRPFLKARAELTFDFWDFYFTSLASTTQKRMGLGPNASWHTNFQNGFLMMSMGMFARRGEFAKFQPAFDKFIRKLAMNPLDADATDEATPTPTNGCLSIADVYDLKARPSGGESGDFHPSWQAMWDQYYQSV